MATECSLLKSILKKLSPKINVKKHKISSLVRMWILVKIGKADWSVLEWLLLLHV